VIGFAVRPRNLLTVLGAEPVVADLVAGSVHRSSQLLLGNPSMCSTIR